MADTMFQDETEKYQHEEAMSRLCAEFPEQKEQISRSYRENLKHLISDASIRTYLPIFVSRKVRDGLRKKH